MPVGKMHLLATGLFCWLCLLVNAKNANEQAFWRTMARLELKEALEIKLNMNRAKNVILFIGDGMGPNTVTATRIHKQGESGYLSYEKFPHVGVLKTYCSDELVPDSACTATALLSGVKVNFETIGVDSSVKPFDCKASLNKKSHVKTLASLALEAGMNTGFVTTQRVTHATPSAVYAHTAFRKWECENYIPPDSQQCKDIARQLIEDEPGRNLHVIMGGGRQCLVSNSSGTIDDPIDLWACSRKDGRDLIKEWKTDKEKRKLKYNVVQNNGELDNLSIKNTDYLLGVFANGHLKMEHERDKSDAGMPSVTKMTEIAIKILQKHNKGYFLMVEGGNIDMAHHRGHARTAINEAATLDEAVKAALQLINTEDTLIIVTSDHTHTLSINGYVERGTNIFGLSKPSLIDGRNYTTLSYTTGALEAFQYYVVNDSNGKPIVERRDPSLDDTTDYEYVSQAGVLVDENTHGGGDVIVYAKGPHAHLFHSVHEQHYVTDAITYAAGIGDFINNRPNIASKPAFGLVYPFIIILLRYLM